MPAVWPIGVRRPSPDAVMYRNDGVFVGPRAAANTRSPSWARGCRAADHRARGDHANSPPCERIRELDQILTFFHIKQINSLDASFPEFYSFGREFVQFLFRSSFSMAAVAIRF